MQSRIAWRAAAIALALLAFASGAENISIRMEAGAFKVAGWRPGKTVPQGSWSSVFAIYAGAGDVPPMLGVYAIENGFLIFRPRFPLTPGFRVRAVFRPPEGTAIETMLGASEKDAAPSTHVEHVYPSSDLLPANLLKFYVHFSAPMRRGEAWRHIHLVDQTGSPVDLPFLEIDQELWDQRNQRITVLFDPGRIKRGVLPREESGAAIEAGRDYALIIDRDWLDARGAPLRDQFRKPFRVREADRMPLDPKQWRLRAPAAGTAEPLVVDFPNAIDSALLSRLLGVLGAAGKVAGTVSVDRNETRWSFTPRQPWQGGGYRLTVDASLEDVAGNRIGRAFDVDTFEPVTKRLSTGSIAIPFQIAHQ